MKKLLNIFKRNKTRYFLVTALLSDGIKSHHVNFWGQRQDFPRHKELTEELAALSPGMKSENAIILNIIELSEKDFNRFTEVDGDTE